MDFLGDLIGDAIADKVGKRLGRLPGRDWITCAARAVDGKQDGLSGHWRTGSAQLTPGQLVFRQRHAITVTDAEDTGGRVRLPAPLGDCAIARLRTPAGTVELAMPPEQLALAVQELMRDAMEPPSTMPMTS